MTKKTAILLLSCVALIAGACGGEDSNEVGSSEAATVTRVAWGAISQAQTQIAQGIDSAGASDANNAQADLVSGDGNGAWTISGTIQNPNGSGELQLSGSASRSGTTYTATVTGTFVGWTSEGITLDGPLTLTFDLASLIPADITSTLKGTLEVSGLLPIKVPVSVDLTAMVKGTQANVCGTVAGQPVAIGAGC
ncbi:MAG: hypothetical protein KC503_24145 [Myxococcales bacterium]|nr:hypothetical protein [Myxococcales bacterium]